MDKKIFARMVVISGKAQAGKDTTAGFIKEALDMYGYKTKICHYADLLKYICTEFFNWNGEKDDFGRSLLQYIGTDIIRKASPDYWVNFLTDMILFFDKKWDFFIVPDCRFPNEVSVPKRRGLDVFHINVIRPDYDSGLNEDQKTHISENAMKDVIPDFTINNNGTLDDLRATARQLVEDYCNGLL